MLRFFTKRRFNLIDMLVIALAGEALDGGHWILSVVMLLAGSSLSEYLERRQRTKEQTP